MSYRRTRLFLYIGLAALVPATAAIIIRVHSKLRQQHRKTQDAATAPVSNKEMNNHNNNYNHNNIDNDTSAKISEEERQQYHAALLQLKTKANENFQTGRYEEALEMYQGCLDACAALGAGDAEASKVDQIVRANVVLVFIKLQRPEEARMTATFLLQDEKQVVAPELKAKVLYRRGLASKALGDKESAMCDFKAALNFSSGNRDPVVERAIAELTRS